MDFRIENINLGARKEPICPLCADPTISDNFQLLLCCGAYVCSDCLRSYIRCRVEDGHHLFPCPMPKCQDELTNELMDTLGTPEQKHKIELNKVDASNTTTTRSCPNCSHITRISEETYQLMNKAKSSKRTSNKVNRTICESCNQSWCYFCYGPIHAGVSCKHNKCSKDWDGINHQQNSLECPRCGTPVQRDNESPSMSCSSCSCLWCYNCGKETDKSHLLLGTHSGNKWQVNACGDFTFFGSKKITKILRWLKVINEVLIFTLCGITILLICFPILPVLIFIVPPVFFLICAGKMVW